VTAIKAQPDRTDLQGERHWLVDGITIIPKGVVIPSGNELER
jgi:hypothetical protein